MPRISLAARWLIFALWFLASFCGCSCDCHERNGSIRGIIAVRPFLSRGDLARTLHYLYVARVWGIWRRQKYRAWTFVRLPWEDAAAPGLGMLAGTCRSHWGTWATAAEIKFHRASNVSAPPLWAGKEDPGQRRRLVWQLVTASGGDQAEGGAYGLNWFLDLQRMHLR